MILTGDPFTWEITRPTAIAIGVFDGVHRGHQRVMRDMTAKAGGTGLLAAALTFDPHPLEFLAPEHAPAMLTTVEQRAELLAECGVEVLGVLPFLEIRDLDPVSFVAEIIAGRLRAAAVAVGADFRFGRDRGGDVTMLAELGDDHGYSVDVVEMIGEGGPHGTISSTRIRSLIAEGDVTTAAALLGRPFELVGPVIHGEGRGRGLGFATANLHVPDRMAVPDHGVYAAMVSVGRVEHRAVVNIGVRPTFGVSQRTVEAHLMGIDADLYGAVMRVRFIRRIRAERRFDGIEALRDQITRDVSEAERILDGG